MGGVNGVAGEAGSGDVSCPRPVHPGAPGTTPLGVVLEPADLGKAYFSDARAGNL
jgi:hypothetical protein